MGLDLGDKFGSNPKAEIDGVWHELGDGAAVKVARIGNKEAAKAYRKLPKAVKNALDEGTLEEGQAKNFIAKFLADHILKDWRGLADNGLTLPEYDAEQGKKFMLKYRRFRDRVWELGQDDDLFNVESEDDAKNLPGLSTGISGTTPMPSKPSVVAN